MVASSFSNARLRDSAPARRGAPRSAAADLRSRGWDATHVVDEGLGGKSDADVLAAAAKAGRTLVTLDSDVSRLLFLSGAAQPSLLYFRIEGLDRISAVNEILRVVPMVEPELRAGAIVAVDVATARVRPLPLK